VGDCLADLPDQDRSSGPFSSLAAPVRAFAAAVLKFKLDCPASIKLLRRLLAALLPDGNTGKSWAWYTRIAAAAAAAVVLYNFSLYDFWMHQLSCCS